MKKAVSAIDMISQPNFFSVGSWNVVSGSPATLWFRVEIDDALGRRRYVMPQNGNVTVEFMRARSISVGQPSQTLIKQAATIQEDRSLWRIDLSSSEVDGIIGGTVIFNITENNISSKVSQSFFITKTLVGAGC